MSFFNRLFKFRIFKFRTTLSEELEDLHTESLHVQQSLTQTRLLQRKWTKSFAIYAIIAYLTLNIVYFTIFLSHDYLIRTYAVIVSLAFGALLYGIHWLICWYFRTAIQMKEDRLASFKDRKQELIEEVKNKETYAVAKNLIEKYGETVTLEVRPTLAENNNRDLRQRGSAKPTLPGSDKASVPVPPPNIGTLETFNPQSSIPNGSNRSTANPIPGKLPRTILPPQRTFWGAILDAIVGDGPSKRYALICKSCNSHNGMALEEEFEYISFRCAYCNYFNSARKQKPVFHGSVVAHDPQTTTTSPTQNESNVERIESSTFESSNSNEDSTGLNITCRSIPIPTSDDTNESSSRFTSVENQRENNSALSSSQEN
ncbi:unnamed protein product [Rotaria sp. Silwood2]|nr:unnamed protein product [Rotaria sp. Silwood2]CAF2971882.1 unnamed protein product [Rotaria sp. Silwood2]CAF3172439.1 unnamed protein product [Rotaria sp. Silwood2]CAF3269740.1 unnamed protein product [Rotaria sp. Silwood2]CAF3899634.1 unnamed protein product [Rotaria sp. Silwood2]